MKVFYALKEELLKGYTQVKDDLLKARSQMTEKDVSDAKVDILKECQINDFDPESGDSLYTVTDGIANIPIAGMLTNKVDICAAFFGETVTTYKFIQEAVLQAENDPSVKQIIFHANSGGGYAEGCEITSQIIAGCKKKKYAAVYDMAASACYWLISQCDEIISVSRSAFIGSIGVAAEVINRDKQDEKNGIKRQTVTNTESKDKRPNYNTKEGMQIFVDELDAMYRVFTSTILKKREGVLTQKKIDDLSGRVLISEDALDYGLIDRFVEASELTNYVKQSNNAGGETGSTQSIPAFVNKTTPLTGENTEETMKLNEFLAQNPEAKIEHDQIVKAKGDERYNEGVEAGKTEVQARIKKVTPVLASDAYDKAVKTQAQKAINGEISIEAFESVVAIEDMRFERVKSEKAQDDTATAGETQGEIDQSVELSANGEIKVPGDFKLAQERAKKQFNIGGGE